MGEVELNVLRAKLGELTRLVAFLRGALPSSADELASDLKTQLAVLHAVQLAAQIVCDVALHVGAAEGLGVAQDYRAAVLELGARSIVPRDLAARLAGLAGLRNILVHQYERVDLERVRAGCASGLGDLDAFARAIADRYAL